MTRYVERLLYEIYGFEYKTGYKPNYIRMGVEVYSDFLTEESIILNRLVHSSEITLFGIEVEIDYKNVDVIKVGYLEELFF